MIKYIFLLLACLIATPSWAAISYVGGQCGSFVGTTSAQTINFALVGGSDAAPIVGDLVVAAYVVSAAADNTLIIDNTIGTDYTLLGTEMLADDTVDTNLRVAYRVMPDPTETQIVLTSNTGGSGNVANAAAYCFKVYRGVHATPLEQAVQQGTGTNTLLVNPGSITPTTAGTWVVTFGAGASTNTSGNYASSDLTLFQENNADDGNAAQMGAGHTEWTSGAVAPADFTWSGTDSVNYSYAWMMVALAPAEAPASAVDAGNAGAIMLLLGR